LSRFGHYKIKPPNRDNHREAHYQRTQRTAIEPWSP